jgi:hypothetical protein
MIDDTNKLVVNVEFKEQAKEDFIELKQKLRMENNNDVIRWAIAFANKKFK